MKVWNQAPLVRLLLPFLVGIVLAVYFPVQLHTILVFASCLFVVIAAIVLIPKFNTVYRRSFLFGLLLNTSLIIFAYQLTLFHTQKYSPNHFSNYCSENNIVYARLADSYIEKEKSLKVVVEVLAVRDGNEWRRSKGKAMLHFKKNDAALNLKYGDELIIQTQFKEVPAPQNPGEFNYKRFLSFHNIWQQAYVSDKGWMNAGCNSGDFMMSRCIQLRKNLLDVFQENQLTGDELSVGAALLLGYTDKLDADIISAYSNTGALHVLSVSGLHVAIVYMVFSWMLFFLDKHKRGRIIKAILLILFLWFYAALTGLSPSVLRAATMFSFIIVAKTFSRHTNIYNTLAASAILLLLINPYLIMEVGFQLSYLAVLGIVYIQPKIHAWLEIDNWLLDQIWTITTVSIAAQIATFPLGLQYFHQFPNYFLLSNLIVIPISTLILYIGIAVFTFSPIPFVVNYLAIAFTWLIWFLNFSVKWIESLPFSVLQGISISVFETWLLYGLTILLFVYTSTRQYKYLMLSLSFGIIILVSQTLEQYTEYKQKKIMVYNIPKTSAIDFINGKNTVLLTDSVFAKNKSRLSFHIMHNWWDLGVTDSRVISADFKTETFQLTSGFIQFLDKRIMILQYPIEFKSPDSEPLSLDYLIVSGNVKMTVQEIKQMFHAKMLIFDSSNSDSKIGKWKEECTALDQEYYAVKDEGALELIL